MFLSHINISLSAPLLKSVNVCPGEDLKKQFKQLHTFAKYPNIRNQKGIKQGGYRLERIS